jgi:hypothetical protein
MRARLGLLICSVTAIGTGPSGCTRENPAFDDPMATQATDADTIGDELPPDTGEGGQDCKLASGTDMTIKVPQPCGETDDNLDVYEHWFKVVGAVGSTWSVQFCDQGCLDCAPLPGDLEISPLPLAELAGIDSCLLVRARRLGTADDCNYQAISVEDSSASGGVLILVRRTELLDIPPLDPTTGLAGFAPGLVVDEVCDCDLSPDSCCGDLPSTVYNYEVNDTLIELGETVPVTINQRPYDFWAFNAYVSNECDAPINLSWALTAG